jgi:chromosome partitioning protein
LQAYRDVCDPTGKMIVTVGNTKGGTGKTTFAVQIALERQAAGRTVLLVDADRQASAQKVMTMRVENGHKPLACVQLADGRLLRAQLAPLADQHADTVIDAGGHDSEALRVAMLRTELLVVPVQPRGLDVFELETMAELIERAQDARQEEGRPPLRVLAALSMADPGDNRDTRDTLAALRELPAFTVAGAILRRRKAIANATANGLSISEWRPLDRLAWDEIRQLTSNVFDCGVIDNVNPETEAHGA